ncbi:MAG: hypothetical protein QM813_06995 [Verrucomicrobiota bacterium]
MKRFWLLSLIALALAVTWMAQAEPLEVGGEIPKLSAKDQHGVAYTFTNGTACLLIAMDMDSAKAANQKLAAEGTGFLEKHNAVYLMDVHTMPAVGQFFALRKMRKYPQRIILIETANTMNWVPVKTNHITVLKLTKEGKIEKISYWQPTSETATNLFK